MTVKTKSIREFFYAIAPVLILTATVLVQTCSAVPADPNPFSLKQPDGSVFQARMIGDERCFWIETLDGYTILKDSLGWWAYAAEDYLPSAYRVSQLNVPTSLRKHIHPLVSKSRLSVGPQLPETLDTFSGSNVKSVVNGTKKILVILVNFTDNPRVNASKYIPSYYSNLLFNTSNNKSMTAYYNEISYGKLNLTGDVAGNKWYTSSHSMSYYGTDTDASHIDDYYTLGSYELICEAASLANSDINFADYDSNGDGVIDHLMIIHAGCGQEHSACTMTDPLWSVAWRSTGNLCGLSTYDGKTITHATIISEESGIGTGAHEFGHDLGLPDLYDTDYSSSGIGKWGLMSGGSWLGPGNDGSSPAHMCAWSKYLLGWVNPQKVNTTTLGVEVSQVESSDDVYLLLNNPGDSSGNLDWTKDSPGTGEYFLIENRQKTGFDYYLPKGGILIWHVDETRADNDNEARKLVDLEEAHGGTQNLDTYSQYNQGDSGDPFYSPNKTAFTCTSDPNSKFYNNTCLINVTDISNSSSTMTLSFYVSGTPTPTNVINLTLGNVTPSLGGASTLFNYTVTYTHGNNTAPSYVRAVIDSNQYDMVQANASDVVYSNGKTYYYNTTLSGGNHTYSFTTSDGIFSKDTNTLSGPYADAQPPGVSDVNVTPGTVNNSETVYISASVSDDVQVDSVYAEIISPNTTNYSIQLIFQSNASIYANSFNSTQITGRYNITITANDTLGNINNTVKTYFNVVDLKPPSIIQKQPTNTTITTLNATLNVITDENAYCRWSLTNLSYALMQNQFQSGEGALNHSTTFNASEGTNIVYVSCSDLSGNNMTMPETLIFTVDSIVPVILNTTPANNTIFTPYTRNFILNLTTNEPSSCRYSNTSGLSYMLMAGNFTQLSQSNGTRHTATIGGNLSENTTVNLYVKCSDLVGNNNTFDYALRYRISYPDVILNEFMPSFNATDGWVELYNRGETDVDLGGWALVGAGNNTNTTYVIPNGTVILEEDFSVFYGNTTSLNLNPSAGEVRVYDRILQLKDNFTYYDGMALGNYTYNSSTAASIGRASDGVGSWVLFNNSSPGTSNVQTLTLEFNLITGWNLISLAIQT